MPRHALGSLCLPPARLPCQPLAISVTIERRIGFDCAIARVAEDYRMAS